MQVDHGLELTVPQGDGVPLRTRHAIEADMRAQQAARLQRAAREGRGLEEARKAYLSGVKTYLGAARHASYRALLADLKAEQAAELHPPHGPRMSRAELEALHKRRRTRSAALLRKLRINGARLQGLSRRAQAKAERATAPKARTRGKQPVFALPQDVPLEVRESKGNPWTILTPPFQGWGGWYEWWPAGDFYKGVSDYTNKDTGQAGHLSRVSIHDASDIDICNAYYRTSFGSWYKMPKTGLVEVWIEGQLGHGQHRLELDDEWGFSDSTVHQWSYLSLQTWGPPNSQLQTALMSDWYETGYSDGHWNTQFLTSGKTYWAHLFSDVVYAKNAWVYVDAGVYSRNYVYTNDVEASSRVDFRWFIPRVYVDSTG